MKETENRYNSQANFLSATAATTERKRRQPIVDVTQVVTTPATIYVDTPLTTLEGAREVTSGRDRAIALVIRLAPFSIVWLVLAVGVSWAASMGGWFTLICFAALTACTYAYMDRTEYQFSRNGLERHKVDTIAGLKMAEMEHQQELKRMALEATLKMLEARNSDDY